MSRTSELGDEAEALAAELLRARGYTVQNLNEVTRNHPVTDLKVEMGNAGFCCSVKADRTQWQIRLGASVRRLKDEDWLIAFLPTAHRSTIDLAGGAYRVLVVPGAVARNDGTLVHETYLAEKPGRSGSFSPAVKFRGATEVNRSTFARWLSEYENAWHLLPGASPVGGGRA